MFKIVHREFGQYPYWFETLEEALELFQVLLKTDTNIYIREI